MSFDGSKSKALEIANKVASTSPIKGLVLEDFWVQAFRMAPLEWKRTTAAMEKCGRIAISKVIFERSFIAKLCADSPNGVHENDCKQLKSMGVGIGDAQKSGGVENNLNLAQNTQGIHIKRPKGNTPALKASFGIGQAKKAVPARLVSRRSLKRSVLPKVSVSPSGDVLSLFEKLDCASHVNEAVCGQFLVPLLTRGSFHRLVDGPLASAQPIPTLSLGFPVVPFSCPSKWKSEFFHDVAFDSKRGVSLTRSPIKRHGLVMDKPAFNASLDPDPADLEEHLTLAVLKAKRAKIALRKRQSPHKYVLVDDNLDSASDDVPHVQLSFTSKPGMVVGPQPPPVGQ
ncbi:hypothetical protein CJ030_MR0G006949 [Morella rubra]|uniref:Uncharacterized protein n=1 Tax=Morella rubra TaxID=262757 RepID=A0A6A1UJH4_9ROSI|nr:hypothetical protein CJ030_MR0G006949 [Morella rubra]